MTTAVGILGLGTYLPPEVRGNDWWPDDVVAGWRARLTAGIARLRTMPPPSAPGAARVVQAMIELGGDPFEGVRERRVLAAELTATDMEVHAATAALAAAGVAPDEVDLLLLHSAVPEYQLSNVACPLHHRLGLPPACLALEAHAAAYSFLAQLALAVPMIESGRVRRALLVQSSAVSRVMDPTDPVSAKVGDAASAVVIGPVAAGSGVQAAVHRVDGTAPRALIAAAPGGRWYDGRSLLSSADPASAQRVFLDTVDQSQEVITSVLANAGVAVEQVDFFAVHQGTPWLRRLVQEHAGLTAARSIDLFERTAYVFAASIPLVLAAAVADGALRAGDQVIALGGGTGMTCGATALRWSGAS